MSTAFNKPYRLENFPELIPVLEKVKEAMTQKLRNEIRRAVDGLEDDFSRAFQISKPATEVSRSYTIAELAESYVHETDAQRLFPELIEDILLGRHGMVRRRGGGSPMPLGRDPLIGFIYRRSENEEIGPIIAGGRHRFMALQIMLKAAVPEANIEKLTIRCQTCIFRNRDELVRAIFLDQEGRTMSRAEKREREAGALQLTSIEDLRKSLAFVRRDDYPTALGGYIRLCAIESGFDQMSLDQFAASGVTAFSLLKKSNKGLNQKVHETNGRLLADMGEAACNCLPTVLPTVMSDTSRSPKKSKLAKAIARQVAAKLDLNCVA